MRTKIPSRTELPNNVLQNLRTRNVLLQNGDEDTLGWTCSQRRSLKDNGSKKDNSTENQKVTFLGQTTAWKLDIQRTYWWQECQRKTV